MPDFKPAVAGEPLDLVAGEWNAVRGAASHVLANKLGHEGGTNGRNPLVPSLRCMVSWGGGNLPEFSVLTYPAIGTTPAIDPAVNPFESQRTAVFAGTTPAAATDPVLITTEPYSASAAGLIPAITHGIAICTVNVTDASHAFAMPTSGVTSKLTSTGAGSVRILYKPSGTGDKTCVVYVEAPKKVFRGDYYTMHPTIGFTGETATVSTPDGGSPVEQVLCWTTTVIPAGFDATVLVGLSLQNLMYWRPSTTIGASLGEAGASRVYAILARVDDAGAVIEYLGTSGAFAEKYTMFFTSNVAGAVSIVDFPPSPKDDNTVFAVRVPPRSDPAKYAVVLRVDYTVPTGAVPVTTGGYVQANYRTAVSDGNNCGTFLIYGPSDAGGEFSPVCS